MAPRHHSAMKYVGPARVQMGVRTIFNLLGPLSNPAGVTRQFTGVFAHAWVEPLANVLNNLGCEAAWVVHGSDGLDEMTTTGPSHVAELKGGKVSTFDVSPEDAGLSLAKPEDLKGGDAETNASALGAVLDGDDADGRDQAGDAHLGALGEADQRRGGVTGEARVESAPLVEGMAREVEAQRGFLVSKSLHLLPFDCVRGGSRTLGGGAVEAKQQALPLSVIVAGLGRGAHGVVE